TPLVAQRHRAFAAVLQRSPHQIASQGDLDAQAAHVTETPSEPVEAVLEGVAMPRDVQGLLDDAARAVPSPRDADVGLHSADHLAARVVLEEALRAVGRDDTGRLIELVALELELALAFVEPGLVALQIVAHLPHAPVEGVLTADHPVEGPLAGLTFTALVLEFDGPALAIVEAALLGAVRRDHAGGPAVAASLDARGEAVGGGDAHLVAEGVVLDRLPAPQGVDLGDDAAHRGVLPAGLRAVGVDLAEASPPVVVGDVVARPVRLHAVDAVAVGVVLILVAAPVGSDELQDHAAGPQDPMPGAADLIDHGLELARRVPGELHHAPQSISSAEGAPLAVALHLRDEIAVDLPRDVAEDVVVVLAGAPQGVDLLDDSPLLVEASRRDSS